MRFSRPQSSFPYRLVLALALTLSLCAAFTFFGIQGQSASASTETPAFVRVIHASPYVGTVDAFLDGNKLLSSFAFGSVTDYASIPPGSHKVQLALIGNGIGASVLTQTLAVTPGVSYTVAAIGTTPTSLSLEVFVDNNLITPGLAKVRVYHLSPDVGPLSVSTKGNTLISSIAYQQASQYLTVPPASYVFSIDALQVNATLPITETLQASVVTSIFTVGMFSGSPKLELVPAQASGLPGLPNTGSDPSPIAPHSPPITPWLPWLAGALIISGLWIYTLLRRRAGSRTNG